MLIDNIRSRLDAELAGGQSVPFGTLRSELHHLFEGGDLKQLLVAIRDDAGALERCASQSYAHQNGFDKIVLLSASDGSYKLRLHLWSAERSDVAYSENIHNHRWNFASVMLRGRYRFQQFVEQPGVELFRYRYSSPEELSSYGLVGDDRTAVRMILDATFLAGMSYELRFSELHRVMTAGADRPITLMLQGSVLQTETIVISESPVGSAEQLDASRFSILEIRERLNRAISDISA